MTKRLTAVVALAFFTAATLAPGLSEEQPNKPDKNATAQQQKMKDCAAKWNVEKAAKNLKGREAYNAFMKDCLKG